MSVKFPSETLLHQPAVLCDLLRYPTPHTPQNNVTLFVLFTSPSIGVIDIGPFSLDRDK